MKFRRRQYIIKKGYQYGFIAVFTAVCILLIALSLYVGHRRMESGLERERYRGHIPMSGTAQIVVPIAAKANLAFILAGVIGLAGVSYAYARKTQAMVEGLGEGLELLREGRLDFEFDDEECRHQFPELNAAFNEMVRNNRSRIEKLKAVNDEMQILAGTLKSAGAPGGAAAHDAVEELNVRVEELFGTLDEFKL